MGIGKDEALKARKRWAVVRSLKPSVHSLFMKKGEGGRLFTPWVMGRDLTRRFLKGRVSSL